MKASIQRLVRVPNLSMNSAELLWYHHGPRNGWKGARSSASFAISCRNPATMDIGHYHPRVSNRISRQMTRFFSSMASNSSSSMESWWEESTTKMLSQTRDNMHSFDSLQWHKAEAMIIYWSEKDHYTALDYCFQLLDRLANEAAEVAAVGNNDPNAKFHLNIYLLHAILLSWKRLLVQKQPPPPTLPNNNPLLPSTVYAKIENYKTIPGFLLPNIATYTILLDCASCFVNPSERIVFTEELLESLMKQGETDPLVRPTEVTMGIAIKAWSKSGSSMEAQKSEQLLRRALALKQQGDNPAWQELQINTVFYTSVLSAYANAGDPESAERLLREMYTEYILHGNVSVQPNVRSFNTVLLAWSKYSNNNNNNNSNTSHDAFDRAKELLDKMMELYSHSGTLSEPPDAQSYKYLLTMLFHKSKQNSTRRGASSSKINQNNIESIVEQAEALVQDLLHWADQYPKLVGNTHQCMDILFRILEVSCHADKDQKLSYWMEQKANASRRSYNPQEQNRMASNRNNNKKRSPR